jgi:predicted DNA-binding transcriptional regulator AlpA
MEPLVVAAAEIVAMLDVKRARVFQLVAAPGFPEPVATLSVGKVWLYADVVAWAERTGRAVHPLPAR